MGKKIWIVGAGGFGREVVSHLRDAKMRNAIDWELAGFLDDDFAKFPGGVAGLPVAGPLSSTRPQSGEGFLCAIGDPRTKLRIAREFSARGAEFPTFIHPSAFIGERNVIQEGVILCPMSVVTCDVRIGRYAALNVRASVGHDARIGEGCTLSGSTEMNGFSELEEGAFLGSHALVTPGVKMGRYSKAFAGAVVMKDVQDGAQVGGNPARVVPG